jgi:FKBP-type peptidyl-prolyl cis-trans isomerase
MNVRRLTQLSFVLILVASVSLVSCLDSEEPYDPYKQLAADVETIDNYLSSNNITGVIKDPRGVRMVINGPLTNNLPAAETNRIKVNYSGKVLGSSTNFESNKTLNDYPLRQLIAGWQIALTTLPVGSKATVYIPSPLAYGNTGQGSIEPNAILVFDLDFVDVVETETEKMKLKSDTVAIDQFLESKGITAIKDPSGLRYTITQAGDPEGDTPGLYDDLKGKVTYKLLSNSTTAVYTITLDPSTNSFSRLVDQVNGLKLGISKLTPGSKATFYIPSGLAYGPDQLSSNSGTTIIPANSNLIAEVELTEIP